MSIHGLGGAWAIPPTPPRDSQTISDDFNTLFLYSASATDGSKREDVRAAYDYLSQHKDQLTDTEKETLDTYKNLYGYN